MIKKNPKVVVGVPVYNEKEHIGELLDSIVSQTYQNMEVIISDNFSNDGTWEIIKNISSKDQRIKAIKQPFNIGALLNFEYVYNYSDSDFFIWAGGHDKWGDPDMISSCVKMMVEDESIALCVPETIWINRIGVWIDNIRKERIDTRPATSEAGRVYRMYSSMVRCSSMYGLHRRDVLSKCFPFPKNNDTISLFKIAAIGNVVTNDKVCWYRRIIRSNEDLSKKIDRYKKFKIMSDTEHNAFMVLFKSKIDTLLQLIKTRGGLKDKVILILYGLWELFFTPGQFLFLTKEFFASVLRFGKSLQLTRNIH